MVQIMITVEQIRAARGLLGWSQDDLSARTGISKATLTNIERRLNKPRQDTIHAIQTSLEESGIEFIEGPGVRLASDKINVQTFKGKDSLLRLWDDIYSTLKPGEERLVTGVKEKEFDKFMGKKFAEMIERFEKKGLRGRLLCLKNENFFPGKGKLVEYRHVTNEVFSEFPIFVYANKFAMLVWEPEQKVVLIENKAIADSYRRQFEKQWKSAKKF